jgi:hypothetical protein
MAQEARVMACGSGCHSSRCLHAQHFRYLLQDPHCPRHGPRHSSLQCSRQASRAPRWYVPHIEFAHYVFVELSQ